MTGRKAAAIAVVIIAAVGLSAYFLMFYSGGAPPPPPQNGNGTTTKTQLSVLSSPATFPFLERWAAQYNNGRNLGNAQPFYSADADDSNIPVLYSNVSSFLADHAADVAVSGRPVQPTGNFTYAGSTFLPVSPQAITIVYNVPGFPDLPSGLKLDQPTLYAVMSGNVTHWNDPRITELNPDVNLPAEPIVVVHERKAGSATELMERYLNSTVQWPGSSQAAESPDTLSAAVRQTPFSIGYVDFSNAVQTRMTYAALQNPDGEYVMPSSDSIGRAVQNGTIVQEPAGEDDDVMPPTISLGQLGNGSYPIVGFYYVALADAGQAQSPEKAFASLDFARWISGPDGQRMLADVQYPSIYDWNEDLAPLAASLAAGMQAARFENATNLTNNSNDSVYGQVAASGDNIYVVWEESIRGQNYDILLKRSQNAGNTFGATANLSRNEGFSEHPQIAAVGSNVYIVWADNTAGNKEVLFSRSTSSGNAFGAAAPLSSPGINSYNQEIAASGNNVYVVWQEQREGGNAVLFGASTDAGRTFGEPVVISENVDAEAFPKVAADENSVQVVWANPGEPGLRHVSSTDAGATFSEIKQLNGNRPVGEAQVAVYGNNVYVVWGGLNAHEVDQLFYVKSTDAGARFSEPAGINDALTNPMNVELAIMPGQSEGEHFVHIVAQVEVSPENEELLLVSTADGITFTEPVNVSNNAGISECPSIAASGNNIFVVWEDRTAGNNEILYAKGSVLR